MSIDRLIALAQRTGDRLIVHDPIRGRDMVILDIDAYERLLDSEAIERHHDDDPPIWDDNDVDAAGDIMGTLPLDQETDASEESEGGIAQATPFAQSEGEKSVEGTGDDPIFYEEPVA